MKMYSVRYLNIVAFVITALASQASLAQDCSGPAVSMGEAMAGLQAGLTGGAHTVTGEPNGFYGAVNYEERRGFIVPENFIASIQCNNDHILIGEWFATPLDRFEKIKDAKDYVNSLFNGRIVEYYFEIDGNRVEHMQTGTKIGFLPWGRQVAFFNAGYIIKPYSLSPGLHTATAVFVYDLDRDGEPPFFNEPLTAEFMIVDSSVDPDENCSAEPQYGVDWHGCDKSGADLSGVDLVNSNLVGINLSGANLTNALLYGANLDGANLTGVNLTGAGMEGANVPNIIWSNTTCQDGSNSDDLGYCEISDLYHPEL